MLLPLAIGWLSTKIKQKLEPVKDNKSHSSCCHFVVVVVVQIETRNKSNFTTADLLLA